MKSLIYIENGSIGYSKTVLTEVNLTLNANEIVVIIGENGSGKSTLMKTITGLLKIRKGKLFVNNKELSEWSVKELAKFQSYVSSAALPDLMMTVKEFVTFGRYPYMNWLAKPNAKDIALIEQSISDCDLTALSDKAIGEISDGEKQKVMLSRAFAQETDVLLLDEPTTHLDIKNTNTMFKLIAKSKKELNKSVIFSSHQVEKALKIADKIWLVHNGKVHQLSTVEFSSSAKWKEIIYGEGDS